MRKIPTLDRLLIQVLNERIPERCPEPDWSDREIWIYAGKRQLVTFLTEELKAQENNIVKE